MRTTSRSDDSETSSSDDSELTPLTGWAKAGLGCGGFFLLALLTVVLMLTVVFPSKIQLMFTSSLGHSNLFWIPFGEQARLFSWPSELRRWFWEGPAIFFGV